MYMHGDRDVANVRHIYICVCVCKFVYPPGRGDGRAVVGSYTDAHPGIWVSGR